MWPLAPRRTGGPGTTNLPPSMFTKVLVANRGEIAVRIIRALEEMGIASVAVYSELDRDALHVARAGEAYNLGEGPAAENYLSIEKILDVAQRIGGGGDPPRLWLPRRECTLRAGLRAGGRGLHRSRPRARSKRWAQRRARAS